jgi:hypothetical protein
MKFEMFSSMDIRTEINDWLTDHPDADIKFVSQTVVTTPATVNELVNSLFYED